MNELDELKSQWKQMQARLDATLKLNVRALSAINLKRANIALFRLALWLGFEAVLAAAVVLLLGSFLANHIGEVKFALPAAALLAFAVVSLAAIIRQIVLACGIDHGEPVTIAQKRLGDLRVSLTRSHKWTFILAIWNWSLLMLVGFKGLLGVDAYTALGMNYVIANLALGAAAIPIGVLIARFLSRRSVKSPWLRNAIRSMAGQNVNRASAYLDEIARFERDSVDASAM